MRKLIKWNHLKNNTVYVSLRIFIVLLVGLFVIGTIGFMIGESVSLSEGLSLVLEAITLHSGTHFEGFGRILQITIVALGSIILWFIVWSLLDLIKDGQLSEYFREVLVLLKADNLSNHYVVCGSGRVGSHLADYLTEKGMKFVVIDKDITVVKQLQDKGYLAILGNALDEYVLKEAGIEKAKGLFAILQETEKNILLTLQAKELNPNIIVYSRSEKESMIKQLKLAGARHVVMPEVVGARELIKFAKDEEEKAIK